MISPFLFQEDFELGFGGEEKSRGEVGCGSWDV